MGESAYGSLSGVPAPESPVLEELHGIMQRYGVQCSPATFHAAVNLTFHKYESSVYDVVHRDMWLSLPRQFDLLTRVLSRQSHRREIVALDVGCGTGLASELLLRTEAGKRIRKLVMLDTSAEMLDRARARARSWAIPAEFLHQTIEAPLPEQYDLIFMCSVLHHIPELPSFLRNVRTLHRPAGVFLHIQDPNGDYLSDPELKSRTEERIRTTHRPRVVANVWRRLFGIGSNYIDAANKELLSDGVISRPMSPKDMWRVTDLHDHDEVGVSLQDMKRMLPDYALLVSQSYGFFGVLESQLPGQLRRRELEYIFQKRSNGHYFGATWTLTTESH